MKRRAEVRIRGCRSTRKSRDAQSPTKRMATRMRHRRRPAASPADPQRARDKTKTNKFTEIYEMEMRPSHCTASSVTSRGRGTEIAGLLFAPLGWIPAIKLSLRHFR